MSLIPTEQKTLLALVAQHVESRRPVKTMIIQAARNAKGGAARGQVLADLHSLARYGLIKQHDDGWTPTGDGLKEAAAIKNGKAPTAPAPDPEPADEPKAEAPPVRPKSRDTLRPRQHTAPKPVTREATDPPKSRGVSSCGQCGAPLTPDERRYYDGQCEDCELASLSEMQEDTAIETVKALGHERIPKPCRWRGLDALTAAPDLSQYHDATLQTELRELLMGLGMRSAEAARALGADDPRRGDLVDLGEACRVLDSTLKTTLIAPGRAPATDGRGER